LLDLQLFPAHPPTSVSSSTILSDSVHSAPILSPLHPFAPEAANFIPDRASSAERARAHANTRHQLNRLVQSTLRTGTVGRPSESVARSVRGYEADMQSGFSQIGSVQYATASPRPATSAHTHVYTLFVGASQDSVRRARPGRPPMVSRPQAPHPAGPRRAIHGPVPPIAARTPDAPSDGRRSCTVPGQPGMGRCRSVPDDGSYSPDAPPSRQRHGSSHVPRRGAEERRPAIVSRACRCLAPPSFSKRVRRTVFSTQHSF
jgi:hypothetical protein